MIPAAHGTTAAAATKTEPQALPAMPEESAA